MCLVPTEHKKSRQRKPGTSIDGGGVVVTVYHQQILPLF